MTDKIIRGIAREGRVRFFVTKTTELVETARKMHGTYPAASAALGRTLSVAAIMGSNLKNDDDKIMVEIRGDGPLGYILADANRKGEIRGLVSNPQTHAVNPNNGKLDVGGIIGNGSLRVTYKHNDVTTFSSQVELQTGELGEDFAYYYSQSEQIPSALSVGVLVNEDLSIESAGSILVQILPNAIEEDIVIIENLFSKLLPVSTLMKSHEANEVASSLFEDGEILDEQPLNYVCGCSREQMLGVLATLRIEELQELIEMDKGATLKCQYCDKSYSFTEEDLQKLMNQQIEG